MKKISYKARLWIGIGLMLWSIAAAIAIIIYASYGAPIWLIILVPILAIIAFAVGVIFVPKTNEDGTPVVIEKKQKPKKSKKYKQKKQKRPFMTEEEWREQEEEDDEMMFIDEVVEDD